jgi:phosphonate transport system substrate-binding protein
MKRRSETNGDRKAGTISFLLLLAAAMFAPGFCAADDALRMGVFPRRNFPETARLFTPMADYLGERLGRKVTLVTSRNFGAFWKALSEEQYDIVHYNQYHYIRSAQTYQVISHIEEFGKSTIAATLYVRKDSGITDLVQLRGRTVMFGGGEDAMISHIAIRYMFQQAGLKKNDVRSLFAVNPPNAILALGRRQAAAAGAGDIILELPEVRSAMNTDELTAVAALAPLLQLPVAVRRDMPAGLRAEIQEILVDLQNSETGRRVLNAAGMTGMGKAEDRDYDPHRKIAAAVFGPQSAASGRTAAYGQSGKPGR